MTSLLPRLYCRMPNFISMVLFLLAFSGTSPNALAQDVVEDLKLQLIEAVSDSEKVMILSDLCWEYCFADPDSALQYAE